MMRFIVAVALVQAAVVLATGDLDKNREGRILAYYSKETKEHTGNALPQLDLVSGSLSGVSSSFNNYATLLKNYEGSTVSLLKDIKANLGKNSDLLAAVNDLSIALKRHHTAVSDPSGENSIPALFGRLQKVLSDRLDKIESILGYVHGHDSNEERN